MISARLVELIQNHAPQITQDVVNDLRWLEGGKAFTWVSEREGWRRLYVVPRSGGEARAVTRGPFGCSRRSLAALPHCCCDSAPFVYAK